MDRSIDRNINQLHPSKILDEMGISWNDNLETKTSKLYQKVSRVIPDIEWPFFAPYIEAKIPIKPIKAILLAMNASLTETLK